MKIFLLSAMCLAALVALPGVASADAVADRTEAIRLCRAEVAAQAGDAATVRLDQVRVRGAAVRVDLDVWRDGQLQNVRCDVSRRGEELSIAAITPALRTAALTD